MNVILSWLESIIQVVFMLIKLVFWILRGLFNMITMMTESINIFSEILGFLPGTVVSVMLALCALLIVLRILGRS